MIISKKKMFFSEKQSVSRTDWIQTRPYLGPGLDPNCLQKLSADDTAKLRVNSMSNIGDQLLLWSACAHVQSCQSFKCSEIFKLRERSGSVVECLTRDRGDAGSSLIGVTALWSLCKTHLS